MMTSDQKTLNEFDEPAGGIRCPHCNKIINVDDTWNIINEQIERSKIPRINWKKILGDSLTKIAAGMYARGFTAQETYRILAKKLHGMGYSGGKIYENLKIGISARYGEIKSETRKINEIKRKRKYYRQSN